MIPDIKQGQSLATLSAQHGAAVRSEADAATEITTAAAEQHVVERVRVLRQALKLIKNTKEQVCKPLRDLARQHAELWKPAIDAYEHAIATHRARLNAFAAGKTARATNMLAGAVAPAQIKQAVAVATSQPEATHTTPHYSARIDDASKIPLEVWLWVEPALQKALNAHARKTKNEFDVPGCSLVVEERIVIK